MRTGTIVLALALAAADQAVPPMSRRERVRLREEVRELFYHGYSNYMEHAFPNDVLQPGQCTGSDDWGGITLTLLDTLDTLALMNNSSEFERGIRYLIENLDFDVDSTVSLFETNIRALGGLLSAHVLAADRSLGLMSEPYPESESYGGGLLPLALDLGNRLLPALDTLSGIPFGSINLRKGVAATESPITCTAAAGTLVLEFGALTRLTGDGRFEAAARRAAVLTCWGRTSACAQARGPRRTPGLAVGSTRSTSTCSRVPCSSASPTTSPSSTTRTTRRCATASTATGTSTCT